MLCCVGAAWQGAGAAECLDGARYARWISAGHRAGDLEGRLVAAVYPGPDLAVPCLLRPVQAGGNDFAVSDVIGTSGQQIPMTIRVPMDMDLPDRGKTFLMFRGLPDSVQLNPGIKMRNAWAVSWRDINGVSLVAKPDYEGSFPLEVLFYRGPDLPPLKQMITVNIRPPDRREARVGIVPPVPPVINEPSQVTNTATIPQEPPRVPPATSLSSFEESAMLANGHNFVKTGNLATARFMFEDMAAKGSAAGAYALAQTYDPRFLKSVVVLGSQLANLNEAKKWYRTAAERGHLEAGARLQALEAGQP